MRVLFIGGPRDGHWDEAPWSRLPETMAVDEPELITIRTMTSPVPEQMVNVVRTVYERRRLRWQLTGHGEEELAVYVAQGMPPDWAMQNVRDLLMDQRIPDLPRPSAFVREIDCLTRVVEKDDDEAMEWHTCSGRPEDPHEEVRWQGGPHCWVCGQEGQPAVPPRLGDQAVAPYGWGGGRADDPRTEYELNHRD